MSDAQVEEWELCKRYDDQKHALIEGLFGYINDLSSKLSEAERELHDKKDVVKLLREGVEDAANKSRALQLEKERKAFALVLIDGDCMPFRDELVSEGFEGGRTTAGLLKQAVEAELVSSDPAISPNCEVVVYVYANMKGLAKTYKELNTLPESASLEEFVRGFNMRDARCDYVDAGKGKECSDVKIKAKFELYLYNVHCQLVIFGGSADNGYARLLAPYYDDESVRGRITLLEGPPFAHELAEIKDKFRTVSFDNVFRSKKLASPQGRVPFHQNPPSPSTPMAEYAAALAKALSTPTPTGPAQQAPAASRRSVSNVMLRNSRGQRVDPSLEYAHQDVTSLGHRKFCHSYHILGRCPFLERHGACSHPHGERLNERQRVALRIMARKSPCQAGLDCRDPECLAGHRCPLEYCPQTPPCRFAPGMHNIDVRVVS